MQNTQAATTNKKGTGNSASGEHSRMLYWIAVNGASAAMASYPLPMTVKCIPVPELLIGFGNQKQARAFQNILLTAPLQIARKELNSLRRHRDAVFIQPDNPEPPTKAVTVWLVK
jgi:hypothetical protein